MRSTGMNPQCITRSLVRWLVFLPLVLGILGGGCKDKGKAPPPTFPDAGADAEDVGHPCDLCQPHEFCNEEEECEILTCEEDEECGGTMLCGPDNRCDLTPCTSNEQCPEVGLHCDLQTGRCVEFGCRAHGDCEPTHHCHPRLRDCVPGCHQDEGCEGAFTCNTTLHRCEGGPCEEDLDCTLNPLMFCVLPQGICREGCRTGSLSGCPANQQCHEETRTCYGRGCGVDQDCEYDQYCDPDFQSCEVGCRDDSICPPGRYCDMNSRQCEWPICQSNEECGPDEFCNPATGRCAYGCSEPEDCLDGEQCYLDHHECVGFDCQGDEECDEDLHYCHPESGVCRRWCDEDEVCRDGERCDLESRRCLTVCDEDVDCVEVEYCDPHLGLCFIGCRMDGSGCPDHEPCSAQTRTCGCTTNSDCGAQRVCSDGGLCVYSCQRHRDCPEGQDCDFQAGLCGPLCEDDAFLGNQSPHTAVSIQESGEWSGLRFCPGREDWFRVAVRAGDTVMAEIEYVDEGDPLTLEIYMEDTLLQQSKEDGGHQQVEVPSVAQTGTVFIRVVGPNHLQKTYELRVNILACAVDHLEPNDSIAQAALLSSGLFENLSLCRGDVDWFRLRVFPGTRIHARLIPEDPGDPIQMTVYGPDGQTVLAGSGEVLHEYTLEETLDDGNYYIEVFSPEADTIFEVLYALEVEIGPALGLCIDDGTPPNLTRDQAHLLEIPPHGDFSERDRYLCAGESHWYQVQVHETGQLLRGSLVSELFGVPMNLTIIGPDGGTVLAYGQGTGTTSVQAPNLVSGSHFLKVSGEAGPYRLNVRLSLPGACQPDRLEPNDSMDMAAEVAEGVHADLVICPEDVDWYQVPMDKGNHLDVTVTHQGAPGSLDLEIHCPDRGLLKEVWGQAGQAAATVHDAVHGVYLVKVSGWNPHLEVPYSMNIVMRATQCEGDTSEPNGSIEKATPLILGQEVEGVLCAPDDNWFKITVDEPRQALDIRLRFAHFAGDLDLVVFNADGSQILGQSRSQTDNEAVRLTDVQPDVYHVQVRGVAGAVNTYRLLAL